MMAQRKAPPAHPRSYRTLGILGGMGPWATVDLIAKIVSLTVAERDQDHVPVIIHSVPQIPDRSAAILARNDAPLEALIEGVHALERAGAEILAIGCNTAHHWYEELARNTDRSLLHIVDAVKAQLCGERCERVALLATSGTITSGIYQKRLAGAVRVMTPDPATQETIDATIRAVKAGQRASGLALEVADRLLAEGAQRIVLGCTELPITFAGTHVEPHCLDATVALAEACITAAGGSIRPRTPRPR